MPHWSWGTAGPPDSEFGGAGPTGPPHSASRGRRATPGTARRDEVTGAPFAKHIRRWFASATAAMKFDLDLWSYATSSPRACTTVIERCATIMPARSLPEEKF